MSAAPLSASAAAWMPSSCLLQVAPPSALCSTTPWCPTAQPWRASTNCNAVRLTLTGTRAWRQETPASSEYRMVPRSPAATSRWPAAAMASMAAFKALGVTSAGCVNAAGMGAPAPSARAAGVRARAQQAANAVRVMQRAASGFNPFIERSFT